MVETQRMVRFALAVVAITSCALLFALGATAAGAHTVTWPESFRFEAELPASNGYLLFLRAHGHRKVQLDAYRTGSDGVRTVMIYRTRGRVDRHGIEADFGRFGRIDLRFSGSSATSVRRLPNCEAAKPEVDQDGLLRGRVEFASLGRSVAVATRHVFGYARHTPKRTCSPKPNGSFEPDFFKRRQLQEAEPLLPILMARGHLMARTIDLYAVPLGVEVDTGATSTRRFGRVLVTTSVQAPEGSLEPDEAAGLSIVGSGPRPRGASLSAAAPFSGSATYRAEPGGGSSWLGSLAVEMPGEGSLPVAGPAFHAVVCRYAAEEAQRACERTVAPPEPAVRANGPTGLPRGRAWKHGS